MSGLLARQVRVSGTVSIFESGKNVLELEPVDEPEIVISETVETLSPLPLSRPTVASITQAVSSGTIILHSSRAPLLSQTLNVMLTNVQRMLGLCPLGAGGPWSDKANKKLVDLLAQPKKKRTILAIEDENIQVDAANDVGHGVHKGKGEKSSDDSDSDDTNSDEGEDKGEKSSDDPEGSECERADGGEAEKHTLQARILELEDDNKRTAELETKLAATEAENQHLRQRNLELEDDNTRIQDDMSALEKEFRDEEAENARLRVRTRDLSNELETTQSEMKRWRVLL